jgi:hypothetical protein
MTICKIEEQYTGGGCEHLSVYFPEYNLEFTIMCADESKPNDIPQDGEKWCFNLSNGGTWIDGDYIETSTTQHDFKRDTIQAWCEGYIIAKGYQKNEEIEVSEPYILEDLHQSINDIYAQYDDGKLDRINANELAKRCALAFVATLEDVAE